MGRETCGCEACDAERRRDKWRARAELAEQRIAETTRALDAERAAHAETRKALDAERARVERVREVLTSCAWHIPDGTWLRGAVAAALADAPAQAPAVDASAVQWPPRDSPGPMCVCGHSANHHSRGQGMCWLCACEHAQVSKQAVPVQWGVTRDDLAALRRDAVRDALLAVAEAAEGLHGTVALAFALRARAGQ